jgi:uncharacterized protein
MLRTLALTLGSASVSAVVLAGLLAQGNELWLPPALQTLGHPLYRAAFWITLPAQWLVLQFTPLTDHHVPAQNATIASIITGLGISTVWLLLRRWPGDRPTLDQHDPSRRDLLATIAVGLGGATMLSGLGFGAWGVLVEPARLKLRRYTLPIRGLPAWAEGLRIVQLSDTHYGPYVSLPHLRRAVAMANELEADLVALTGDYVHRTPKSIPDGIGVLCGLEARLGRYAVLGNHDNWEGPEACNEAFRAGGVRMLDRQHVYLGPQGPSDTPRPDTICLAGFGDLWEDEHPPQDALEGVPEDIPRIVLSHNPDYAERIGPDLRVDLMLSGHTHGGQVFVPGKGTPKIPSNYGQWYAGGVCQGPHCPVVVSRGVGMAYLPVRLGVPPEIVEITLTRAPEAS